MSVYQPVTVQGGKKGVGPSCFFTTIGMVGLYVYIVQYCNQISEARVPHCLTHNLLVCEQKFRAAEVASSNRRQAPVWLKIWDVADCVGEPIFQVNLLNSNMKKCTDCYDRCQGYREGGAGGWTSVKLEGAGTAAIAWDCVGDSDAYLNPGFDIGGTFDQAAGCYNKGGGAIALCGTTVFTKASYNTDLATECASP